MNNEIKEIIVDLMTELYVAKGYTDISLVQFVGERNAFEARMKEIYDNLDEKIGACDEATAEDYEDEIDSLQESLKEQKEEYDALLIKYEDLEEEYGCSCCFGNCMRWDLCELAIY